MPTKQPVIDGIIQTKVTQYVSVQGGFNNHNVKEGINEMLLVAIFGALLLIIILCCCFVCIYWHKNKKNKENSKNIELTEVASSSPIVDHEGNVNGTDITDGTGESGNKTNQTMSEPGTEFETEQSMLPIGSKQQLIQQQFVPMNGVNMGMMPMAMGSIQNDVMSVAMGMPNMMSNIVPITSGSQNNVTKGNSDTLIENTNDLPDERGEEEQNQLQDKNVLENDDEYEYFYDDEEQDNNMYGKGNNTTSGGQ
eukprot:422171_1